MHVVSGVLSELPVRAILTARTGAMEKARSNRACHAWQLRTRQQA